MIVFKTWLTAFILNTLLFAILFGDMEIAAFEALISFLGSLFAIPVLYIFWKLFSHEPCHKAYILLWSCIVASVIAATASIATIGIIDGDMSLKTLMEFREFIYIPIIAGVLSMLINHKGIYTYTQGHLQTQENSDHHAEKN
jgi:hypothetical protein